MRFLVALLLISVALAGCGDKGGEGTSFMTPEKEEGVYVISIGSSIEPAHAKVPKDVIVEWRIEGTGCHILAGDGSFDSKRAQGEGTTYNNGIVPPGQTYRWIAGAEGDHAYKCEGRSVSGVLRVS